jgi:hypothetical protein
VHGNPLTGPGVFLQGGGSSAIPFAALPTALFDATSWFNNRIPIRLFMCYGGYGDNSTAQQLANWAKVTVISPTAMIYLHPTNGTWQLGDDSEWKEFRPTT